MTDLFRPTAVTGPDIKPFAARVASPAPEYTPFANQQHPDDLEEEDDGQIDCICGFNEDDGNTVACDTCNKWQHIICYYPQYGDSLPDELQHWCVKCRPESQVNAQAAHIRQREARADRYGLQNGNKRQTSKSHKKKTKDAAGAGLTNGWPLDKSRHDRTSASPRDQQPPTKRPKTSHRASSSTANTLQAVTSRKRNGSTNNHRRSVSRSPDARFPLYSTDFIRIYRDDEYNVPHTNVPDIQLYSAMQRWLTNPDECFEVTHGVEPHNVFQRWDGDISIIDGVSTLEVREHRDPTYKGPDGQPAMWRYATVSESLSVHACIGELRGHLTWKEEYIEDPATRWSTLRHPEPFVFLHSQLPICIDARNEGTPVRYIRRSCSPNAELKIIITGPADYHFCFIATREIEPGTEIAIAWDVNSGLSGFNARQNGNVSAKDMSGISSWVSTILANCGPCACNRGEHCLMNRFDRRDPDVDPETGTVKPAKQVVRKKKTGPQISPLNTHAVNSRSGSEARKVDVDDEAADSRSTSGSAERGSASRDITPNTHYSANGTAEMSERERRKLAKVEELFSKQDEQASSKQSKKKRSSAGSALNTPSATSSKQLGLPTSSTSRYADSGTSKQSGLPSTKNSSSKRPKPVATSSTASKESIKRARTPRAVYVDSSVQCDMSDEEAAQRPEPPRIRRPFVSLQQRLLQRCARNNTLNRECQLSIRAKAIEEQSKMDVDASSSADAQRMPSIHSPEDAPKPDANTASSTIPPNDDVDMSEHHPADGTESIIADENTARHDTPPPTLKESHADSSSPNHSQPPAHSLAESTSHEAPESDQAPPPDLSPPTRSTEPSESPDMRISMPPPPASPFAATQQHVTNATLNNGIVQSPAALGPAGAAGPIFSPSVTAAVATGPTRKKLSLSDYTRRKKEQPSDSKPDRESSPASVASGPTSAAVVPSLQASSSEIKSAQESGSAVVDDDVKMDDAGPSSSA
jgi:hypothetical protein